MDNKVVFHVGLPKTGTTALQFFLYENLDLLHKNGYHYPDFQIECGVLSVFNNEITQKNGVVFFDKSGIIAGPSTERWRTVCDHIKKCLKTYSVIISAEELSSTESRLSFWKQIISEFDSIEVIIYLRRQDKWMESLWQQRVKSKINCKVSLDTFLETDDLREICDYYSYLEEIATIIGKDRIVVRCYEKKQMKNESIEADLCDYLHIPFEEAYSVEKREGYLNKSLKGPYAEIMRIMNSTDYWFPECEKWIYNNILLNLLEKDNKTYGSSMAPSIRKAIIEQYSVSNRHVAEQYINRKDGKLFYDEQTDDFESYSFTDNEIVLAKSIFSMILQLERRVTTMEARFDWEERKIKRQIENTYKALSEGRRISLFGAGNNCRVFLQCYDMEIDMILDNDRSKTGDAFYGRIIVHPDDVSDWENRFIIITSTGFKEISEQLRCYGLGERDYITMIELVS